MFLVSIVACLGAWNLPPDAESAAAQFSNDATQRHLRAREQTGVKMLSLLTKSSVSKFIHHPSDSVALTVAWHRVAQTFPAKRSPAPEGQWYRGDPLDHATVMQFIGFVEGRLRTQVPDEWQRTLASTTVYPPQNTHRVHQTHVSNFEDWRLHKTSCGLQADQNIDARLEAGQLIVKTASGTCQINRSDLPKTLGEHLTFAATMDDECCVFGVAGFRGAAFDLKFVDRANKSIAWSQTVHAVHWGGGTGTGENSRVKILLTADRVFVFGSCHLGTYVEAFCRKTGKPKLRFSTAVHNCWPANKTVHAELRPARNLNPTSLAATR